jgi:hypothetical protein
LCDARIRVRFKCRVEVSQEKRRNVIVSWIIKCSAAYGRTDMLPTGSCSELELSCRFISFRRAGQIYKLKKFK